LAFLKIRMRTGSGVVGFGVPTVSDSLADGVAEFFEPHQGVAPYARARVGEDFKGSRCELQPVVFRRE
jgi:hypothetical protein